MATAIESLEFQVAGQALRHNELKWTVKTNRHTTTSGRDWGWIEGAPGNVTWSDCRSDWSTGKFNRADASEAVRIHNQWLEDIQPLSIKLVKAQREYESASQSHRDACDKASATHKRLHAAANVLANLMEQSA